MDHAIIGLYELNREGRQWCLYDHSEGERGELIFRGSRAKVAQVTAARAGKLPVFWYEYITDLKIEIIPVTPMQVSQIWRLSRAQMVQLNQYVASGGGVQSVVRWLELNQIGA